MDVGFSIRSPKSMGSRLRGNDEPIFPAAWKQYGILEQDSLQVEEEEEEELGAAAGAASFASVLLSVFGALAVSVAAGFVSPDGLLSDLPVPSLPSLRLRFLSPSFLKSVSYQPLPDKRNDGAVTCRLTWCAPQDGQVSGSGSDIFCRRSKLWPQSAHWNA